MRQPALLIGRGGLGCVGRIRTDGYREQLARSCDVCGSVAAREQSIVSNAMEALGQDVEQEAADELVGRERHRLITAWPIDPIVLVPEGDAVLIGGYEATIGDGNAVSIPG